MGGSLILPPSWYWWDDGLALPWSGCPLPIVEEESAGELTGRWDWNNGVPPLNHPIGTLRDGSVSLTPLPPLHVVEVPQSC